MPRSQITQKRYNLKEAMNQVPHGDIRKVKCDLKQILGLSTTLQVWYYTSGRSQPNLAQAKAVEEYFLDKYKIKDPWKESTIQDKIVS
jgi:hypothetical protein